MVLYCVTLLFYECLLILGTGKSSLVCAMCIGLAGSTTILGRARDVCDINVCCINVFISGGFFFNAS